MSVDPASYLPDAERYANESNALRYALGGRAKPRPMVTSTELRLASMEKLKDIARKLGHDILDLGTKRPKTVRVDKVRTMTTTEFRKWLQKMVLRAVEEI